MFVRRRGPVPRLLDLVDLVERRLFLHLRGSPSRRRSRRRRSTSPTTATITAPATTLRTLPPSLPVVAIVTWRSGAVQGVSLPIVQAASPWPGRGRWHASCWTACASATTTRPRSREQPADRSQHPRADDDHAPRQHELARLGGRPARIRHARRHRDDPDRPARLAADRDRARAPDREQRRPEPLLLVRRRPATTSCRSRPTSSPTRGRDSSRARRRSPSSRARTPAGAGGP